jgi:hypothetical protein
VSSTRIIRRVTLDRIRRDLLVRILAPFSELFTARGLPLADLAATAQDDRSVVRRVHDLLHADVSAVPAELRAQLIALDALANAAGQDALYKLCPELTAVRRGFEDTAAVALLEHPDAFARAKVAAQSGSGLSVSDFDAVSIRSPRATTEACAGIKAGFRPWLEAHGRSRLVETHVTERGSETHLKIEHGRLPTTDDIVGESLDLTQMTLVRAERAHIILDHALGRVSIHAVHAAIKELLRRLVGEHFYGNPDHFRRGGTYTLDPLIRDLVGAAAPDAALGVTSVTLLGITVESPKMCTTREARTADDVRSPPYLQQLQDELSADGVVTWAKFRLVVAGSKRPIILKLSATTKTLTAAPEVEAIVDAWLVGAGFNVVPEHRRVIEAETDAIADGPSSEMG